MLNTPPRDTLEPFLYIQCLWVVLHNDDNGSKMSKTEYDLKAIMYSAYDKPHKLCNISENYTIRQPRLPPNNAGRPLRQFKCPLAWFKWRAGSPPVRFFFREVGASVRGGIDPGTGILPCVNRMEKHAFQTHISKCMFLNEKVWISLKSSLKFVPKVWVNNIPSLVQIMAWYQPADKPLSKQW